MSEASLTTAAKILHQAAHTLRNDIATIRTACQLIEDDEVTSAIRGALSDLHVRLEHAVVAARIELDERPKEISIGAEDLTRFGTERARREGMQSPAARIVVEGDNLRVPGVWAERLVADLLHGAEPYWVGFLAEHCQLQVTPQCGASEAVGDERVLVVRQA